MRVGASHHGTLVLENLHIRNEIFPAHFFSLLCPGANDFLDDSKIKLRQGQIVAGRETHHPAESHFQVPKSAADDLKRTSL